MNILKRQLALLLVFAMTLTMLPMPAHADEVTELETPPVIVEETAEKPTASNEVASTEAKNKPVENAEPDVAAKENAVPAAETPVNTTVDSDADNTEEIIADVFEDTPASDPVEESEVAIDTDATTKDAEVEENTESDPTVESEEDSSVADSDESENVEPSEADTQETTDQMESETEVPATAAFSLRRSAANAAADCAHENTTFVVDSREDYWYYLHTNEAQHVANYYMGDKCDNCGVMVSQVHNYFAEDHVMNENSVCTLCGYGAEEDSCAHSETEIAWDTNHTVTYTPVDATQHTVEGYQYTYCSSCFERVGESFAAEEYEEHSLNTSGKCFLCGYQSSENNGCAHKNTEEKFYFNNPVRYAQFNEDEHYIYRAGTIYCHDCRTDIGSSNTEMWSFEAHTLNDQGNCVYCGYGLGEGYCTHPNSRVIMDSEQEKAYYQKDEGQHLVNFYQYHYCPDCNSRISESFLDAAWEDHDFDASGVCTLCGEVWVCSHPSDAIENVVLISQYIIVSDTQHQKLGSGYPYCTECNKPVGESYPIEERENHVPNESGVCTLCSYDPNCKHENVIRSKPAWFAPRYSQFNSTEHWVYRVVGVACVDCGTNLPNEEESSLWSHVLNDAGVCTYCGYGSDDDYCTHPTTAMAWDSGTTWEPFDDATHIAEGYRYHYCTVCSERISENSYWVDASEEHVQNGDGVCTICGFGAPCAHESMETVTSTQLVNQSLTHHTVETTTYEECTICHEKRNEVTDVEWVEHTPIDAESYGYEAAHPHKRYFICECGSHPYLDGEYHTTNGKVQEEAVCCICHDHKYDTEEETDEGTRQKTCVNCGLTTVTHTHEYELIQTEKLIDPDENNHYAEITSKHKCKTCGHEKPGIVMTIEEAHSPKNPDDYKFRDGHPHLRYAVCECGKEFDMQDEYKTANGTMQAPEVCCLCHGHVFGEPTEINVVIWKVICSVCGYEGRIAASSQEETETTEPNVNADEKQELKDYNIDFIKKNALGKNDIYTLFFNDELREQIEELSEGNAAKGYDFIDGDPAAHLGYAQADYYVDTLMKQCAELDPDNDTIRVSPGELKAICKIIGLEDTVIEAILKEWVWDDRDGCIMEADEFKDKLDQYKDDTGATLLDGLGKAVDIGTFIWDCLSDISVYNAALDGSASAMIDAAVVHMKNSDIDQAQTAAEYIEDLKDPEKRITYIIMKNAGIAEKVRDTITGATGSIPAWDIAFEAATLLNGGLFRTNDVIKSNHGTYWSLQLVDELYGNLESSIAQYENISSDKNYTACMDAYSLYITYLISSYNGVLETRENYSSSLVAQLITDKDVKEKEKALNEQYKAIMEWYELDISAAINDFSIDQVVESIRDNGGFR